MGSPAAGRLQFGIATAASPRFRPIRFAVSNRGQGRSGAFVKRIIVIFAAALALAGCLPVTTKTPVGSTAGFKSDPALYGMWEGAPGDSHEPGVAYFAILPADEGKATAVFVSMPLPVKSGDWASYALTTTSLGPYRYINARAVYADGHPAEGSEAQNTFPILYRVGPDGTLTLYLVDEDAAKAAVNAKKIAGQVGSGTYGDVVLTAAPAELDAFFSGNAGRALFTKPLVVLHKVK